MMPPLADCEERTGGGAKDKSVECTEEELGDLKVVELKATQ